MSLADVLAHPVVRRGRPTVLAGGTRLDRTVRWVHSTDIYESAALLREGDLLLTTGLGLRGRSSQALVSYVEQMAQRGVAGIVLETFRFFSAAPSEMVEEAERLGLPLVGLAELVPFVEVTQAINAAILDRELERLRHVDDTSQALTAVLMAGGGVADLLVRLEELLGVRVDFHPEVVGLPADLDDRVSAIPVRVHGGTVGWLTTALPGAGRLLAEAALERATSAFALAVLRDEPGAQSLLAARRKLCELLLATGPAPAEVAAVARAAGVPASAPGYRVVVGAGVAPERFQPLLDRTLRARGSTRTAVTGGVEALRVVTAVVTGTGTGLADDLTGALEPLAVGVPGAAFAVGPTTASLEGLADSAAEARLAIRAVPAVAARTRVVDARRVAVERALLRGHELDELGGLAREHLGPLVDHDRAHGTQLVETLRVLLDSADGKTEAARRLHVQRQTLYQRLTRIRELLGLDLDAADVRASLLVALRAHRLAEAGPADLRIDGAAGR